MMLSEIGDYCSIIGLIISFATFGYALLIDRKIARFKREVLFNTRASLLLRELKKQNSHFVQLLDNDFLSKEREIKESLNLCRAPLKGLGAKVPAKDRVALIRLSKEIERAINSEFSDTAKRLSMIRRIFEKDKYDQDSLWMLYYDLVSQISELENLANDRKVVL